VILDFSHINLPGPSSSRPGLSPVSKFLEFFLLHLVVVVKEEQLFLLLGQLSSSSFQFSELCFLDENFVLSFKLGLSIAIPGSNILGVDLII
jgi:hypothetical protein